MSQNLHATYPDFRRRKLKAFTGQVEIAFKSLTNEMRSKNKSSKKAAQKKKLEDEASSSEKCAIEEINIEEDETSVKGPSMNSRLSSLYSGPKTDNVSNQTDDDCQVIDDEDESPVRNEVSGQSSVPNNNSLSNPEPLLSDFEKIQAKIKTQSEKLKESRTVNQSSAKAKTPSKNLASYLSSTSKLSDSSTPEAGRSPNKRLENSYEDMIKDQVQSPIRQKSPSPAPSSRQQSPTKSLSNSKSIQLDPIEEVALDDDEINAAIKEKVLKKKLSETPSSSSVKKRKKLEVTVTHSSVSFADFGGNEEVLKNICKLLVHLKHPEVYKKLGVTPPRGFLLHGPPGCGKTLLAHAIAGELELPFIKISAPEIVSGVSGDSEKKLRELFDQALDSAPCVLFIDEIDCITPKRESAGKEMERRIVAQLLTCMDELGERPDARVVVIGATNRADSLDPALRRAGRFDREIALGIPDSPARRRILEVMCRNLRLEEGTDLGKLAHLTPGYVGADLTSLTREAAMSAVNRVFGDLVPGAEADMASLMSCLKETRSIEDSELEKLYIEDQDWKTALKIVQPSAKREGFVTVPDVTWADVGALEAVREELQLAILAPVNHKEQFDSLGLPSSSGVLLVGPPGCGKTLVAKAIANEAGINFISVKGPELINMYVGESERAVRSVFLRAKNSRPCVIFFDEVDSLAPKRSSSSSDSGSSSRVVNQLLTEMDGVEGREGVWIMAATNRPDILDPAVLRPGRLDKILYVGFPGARDRLEILRAITKGGTRPRLGAEVNLEKLGTDSRCEGFSGADVGNLVRQASMIALRETLRSGQRSREDIVLQTRHFERAFSSVRPSVGERERAKYEAMGKKYGVSVDVEMKEHTQTEEAFPMSDFAFANTSQDVIMSENIHDEKAFTIKEQEIGANPEEDGVIRINEVTSVSQVSTEAVELEDETLLRPELRFLPGMEVRVSDKCEDPAISGHCGVVMVTRDRGNKVQVLMDGSNQPFEVSADNLEPSLPEEGDRVKSLVWGVTSSQECAATVKSIDEEDNASVIYGDGVTTFTFPLEKLCKISAEEDKIF